MVFGLSALNRVYNFKRGCPGPVLDRAWWQDCRGVFGNPKSETLAHVGYSGINVTGGGGGGGGATEPNILHPRKYMDLILCTQKNTRLDILDPKKYMIGLNCVRTISLAEIRTQKNTQLNPQPKKIQELKILDPKKYVGPPVTFIPE